MVQPWLVLSSICHGPFSPSSKDNSFGDSCHASPLNTHQGKGPASGTLALHSHSSLPRGWLFTALQFSGWLLGCCLLSATVARAQEQFELVAPQRSASSKATITATELRVVGADGQVTVYSREPRFDSTGGEWIGYFSRNANQVLRWPSINRGNMQIGAVNGGNVQYRYSQMSIRSIGQFPERVVDRPVLPPTIHPGLSTVDPWATTSDRSCRTGARLGASETYLPAISLDNS
ncbi:MAG: hypothetical protein R3C56_01085 [Pirellulaceae bacterium]